MRTHKENFSNTKELEQLKYKTSQRDQNQRLGVKHERSDQPVYQLDGLQQFPPELSIALLTESISFQWVQRVEVYQGYLCKQRRDRS